MLKILAVKAMLNYLLAMSNEIISLAEEVGVELLRRDMKLTCAESCTGGGIASAVTAIAGSSRWFEYGFVTYANSAKQQLLGVSEQLLATEGAVSEAVVQAMAEGALQSTQADVAVAVSGIAGPDGGTEDKPVGTVWFCWRTVAGKHITAQQIFSGDRASIRSGAVKKSLQGILDILKK